MSLIYISCVLLKLHYICLAIVAGLERIIDEGSVTETAIWAILSPFERFYCIQIFIFSFWSLEISDGILRIQKIIIGLDSSSNQRF